MNLCISEKSLKEALDAYLESGQELGKSSSRLSLGRRKRSVCVRS